MLTLLHRFSLVLWLCLVVLLPGHVWAMQNYSEVLRDQYGNAIGGATVQVYQSGTQNLATIFSDNGITTKANSFLTDALTGHFNFYAANGTYDLVFFYPGVTFNPDYTRRISLFDVNDYSSSSGSSQSPIPSGPSFPVSPLTNYQFFLTTDGDNQTCTPGQGAKVSLCRYDGSSWVLVSGGSGGGGGGTGTINTWGDLLATGAMGTSETNKLKVCGINAQVNTCWNMYIHSNGKLYLRGSKNGVEGDVDIDVPISQTHQWCLKDDSGNPVLCVKPDAATAPTKYTFGPNYRPRRSIWFGADALYGDGTNCPSNPTAVIINSGPKIPTFLCALNSASRLYGSIRMPDSWDAGAVTFTHVFIQTAADTGALSGNVSCQARSLLETPANGWGTLVTMTDAAVSGSNVNDMLTSASVTCSGAPQPGDMFYWFYQLASAGTTTAVATLHHVGFLMEYSVTSWSD